MRYRRAVVLVTALALDLALGEPPTAVHPVVWIGRLIAALERRAPARGAATQLGYGTAMTMVVVAAAALPAAAATRALPCGWTGVLAEAALLKTLFAVRALLVAGERVRRPLARGDLDAARAGLRALVSRDVTGLDAGLVAAAAIESLAENLTDSALAPWLAYAGGGLPAAAAYRALNTLDSMVGYRGRYEYLGKAAARADDLVNLLPARLGAVLVALAAPAGGGGDAGRAWWTARRQWRRTASPNAGWTMAAMAGALGVTLEKLGHYRLGQGPAPAAREIRRAQRIAAGAALLGLVAATALAALSEERRDDATARRSAHG